MMASDNCLYSLSCCMLTMLPPPSKGSCVLRALMCENTTPSPCLHISSVCTVCKASNGEQISFDAKQPKSVALL
jgi:hypothetical protein